MFTSKNRELVILWVLLLAGPVSGVEFPGSLRNAKTFHLVPGSASLTVTISKRDINHYDGADPLHAWLLDPERNTLARVIIPDDGEAGTGPAATEYQTETIGVPAGLIGAYRLMLSGTGGDMVYGLQTNAALIMAEGEMLFSDPNHAGSVIFLPPGGDFEIRFSALHAGGIQQVPLHDAAGALVHTFDLTEAVVVVSLNVPAGAYDRSGPWRFDIGKLDVRIEIDDVTHWTMFEDSFFSAWKMRLMVFPYLYTRYLLPGQRAEYVYTLCNQTGADDSFTLGLDCHPDLSCSLIEPISPVSLAAGGRTEIRLEVEPHPNAVGEEAIAHLVATSTAENVVSQSAGVRVVVESSPVPDSVALPIVLTPYRHENYQFGYAPDYVENEVYFDLDNRSLIRQRTAERHWSNGVMFIDGDQWTERLFVPALDAYYGDYLNTCYGAGFLGAKIAFDGEGGAYTLVWATRSDNPRQNTLLYTPDNGLNWEVHSFEGRQFDIETFTGHNALPHPPPVLGYLKTADHPADWCSYFDLLLYLPERSGDTVQLGQPVLVTDNCLGGCQHSGGPASLVTRGGKTHMVWGEITDEGDPGVPTYVNTYDHANEQLGQQVFLAYAPPANDVHNVPAITMDSAGYLHVVTGAHGDNFYYLRSLQPNDAHSGWTEPEVVLDAGYVDETTDLDGRGRQTYVSLACDPEDTLHIAFRQWRKNDVDEHFPGQGYAALSIQSKPREGAWSPARPVVIPPVPGYSIYYHKLTIDRVGNLYLSYSYWTSETNYQGDYPDHYHNRTVLMSADRGQTWKLAQTSDFIDNIIEQSDGGTDAGNDGGSDAGHDAGHDAGFDAGTDTITDAGVDEDEVSSSCGCDIPATDGFAGVGLMFLLLWLAIRRGRRPGDVRKRS